MFLYAFLLYFCIQGILVLLLQFGTGDAFFPFMFDQHPWNGVFSNTGIAGEKMWKDKYDPINRTVDRIDGMPQGLPPRHSPYRMRSSCADGIRCFHRHCA